jgi:amidohydrolase
LSQDYFDELHRFVDAQLPYLIAFRRDIHQHPEVGGQEFRTTERIASQLTTAGLTPRVLPGGTGLLCDIGDAPPTIGLRADIDALPITDGKAVPYRSTIDGVCHACGHDVHLTVTLGAGLFLAKLAGEGRLRTGVRLIFQPAEEVLPGGALDVIASGGLDGLERVFALHCDPTEDAGQIGLKVGAITSAADHVEVRLAGSGGHTARPQLTSDLVAALGAVLTQVPAVLARRVDPRAGVNLTWGQVAAGTASNVIPRAGVASGTLRMLERDAWDTVPALLADIVRGVVKPYGVDVELLHERGVPPVVNDHDAIAELGHAAASFLGAGTICHTRQSLGGEDFGWYVEKVPGALARLGVRPVGAPSAGDLHQPTFDVDESCIGVGVKLMAGVCLTAGGPGAGSGPGQPPRARP